MIKFFRKKKIQNGYAMLFAVIIVSAISVITAGLINATYKQMILSSLAKDSQLAFYQADTASDCALYADRVLRVTNEGLFKDGGEWICGQADLTIKPVPESDNHSIYFSREDPTKPCFKIDIKKIPSGGKEKTTITSRGYNICNQYNKRTVERSIEINYTE